MRVNIVSLSSIREPLFERGAEIGFVRWEYVTIRSVGFGLGHQGMS